MVNLACMGGWCALRDHCPLYHAADRSEPSERLCTPGRDGEVLMAMPESRRFETRDLPSQQTPADVEKTDA